MVRSASVICVLAPLFLALGNGEAIHLSARDLTTRDSHVAAFGEFTNGIYQSLRHENGTTTVEKIAEAGDGTMEAVKARAPNQLSGRRLAPRSCSAGVGCDNIALNSADTDAAVGDLQGQCGGGKKIDFGTHMSIYAIRGDTVAFYCQWEPWAQCTKDSEEHANQLVTDCCGWYGAGSYSNSIDAFRGYSYGYTTVEHGWCA